MSTEGLSKGSFGKTMKNKRGKKLSATEEMQRWIDASALPSTQPATAIQIQAERSYQEMLAQLMGGLPSAMATTKLPPPPPKPPSINPDKLETLKTVDAFRVSERVPDYVEVITAWRAWDVKIANGKPHLVALGKSHVWEPKKIMQAECAASSVWWQQMVAPQIFAQKQSTPEPVKHTAPQMDCTCGIWAFKDLDKLVGVVGSDYDQVRVLGKVSLWGTVVETENGYRAEKAYPSELWLLDGSLEELSIIYDVPIRKID